MEGFISTSFDENQSLKILTNSGYNALFVIEIPKKNLGGAVDHGFADISDLSEYNNEK